MTHSDEDPARKAQEPGSAPWLADYSGRFVSTAEQTMRVATAAADRWGRRSLEDGEWSVDTVTADVIADWEEMTPLLGRWLDLWLEAIQQRSRSGDRANPGDSEDTEGSRPDLPGLMMRRLREYGELWDGAAAKLTDASYRSEDLLDDWFRFWGKAVRDMTAGPALLRGAWSDRAPQSSARQEHDQGPERGGRRVRRG